MAHRLYGNLLPRRTLFQVYAKAGEDVALGSSGVGDGSGDIVVWVPGAITDPLTVALPAPDSAARHRSRQRRPDHRAQEVAGATPAPGGYSRALHAAATGV